MSVVAVLEEERAKELTDDEAAEEVWLAECTTVEPVVGPVPEPESDCWTEVVWDEDVMTEDID